MEAPHLSCHHNSLSTELDRHVLSSIQCLTHFVVVDDSSVNPSSCGRRLLAGAELPNGMFVLQIPKFPPASVVLSLGGIRIFVSIQPKIEAVGCAALRRESLDRVLQAMHPVLDIGDEKQLNWFTQILKKRAQLPLAEYAGAHGV